MEEKTLKVVKKDSEPVKANPEEAPRPAKLTYGQLEQVAHQLSQQNQELYQKLQQINVDNIFKRLDFLFRVVQYPTEFPFDFVTRCVAEIQSIMIIPEKNDAELVGEKTNEEVTE